ncbi:hypothetical protein J5J83_01925 [Azoarcus sp. L1K30]|uniref:hypothetical protein n=1 Tax=Azoarcus sp. L1K30 TaxID=2820277 RepID=UPI001B8349BF|nr:hypothetical protein [Azoarcus sp. L1K30]MBR0564871.1 hypothetical protein [Azoarcus sp. L1K30]
MATESDQYVMSLQIPDIEPDARVFGTRLRRGMVLGAPLPGAGDKPSAALIKGQVTAFLGNLSGQDRQDVEYTTLAAQLNSDVVVPDNQSFENMQAWFSNYSKVMSNLGWVMSFSWEKYKADSQGLSVDAVIIQVLEAVASQNGAAIAKAAIDAIGKLPRDGNRIRLFNNSTMSDQAGKFLIGVASKEKESISLAFGAFALDYRTRDTTVLWFNWKSSDVAIYKDQKVATFNQDYYAGGARAKLEQKMRDHVAAYVEDLDLGF